MASITHIFGGEWSPPPGKHIDPPDVQVMDAMRSCGLSPPSSIIMDGDIHRFCSGTKERDRDKTGWYVIFPDGVPAGSFGCWRSNITQSFRADIGRVLTFQEEAAIARRVDEARKIREANREKRNEQVSETVSNIWHHAGPASEDHPYLKKKGVKPHGARITGDGRLIVPLYDDQGKLSSLQYISADSAKQYHPGGAVGSKFWVLGTIEKDAPVYIAEGFATGATIHETTGCPCVIAYSASNIVPTTEAISKKSNNIIIVADNDKSGVGQNYAEQASAKYGARVIIPPEPGDANDYAQNGGDLKTLLTPAKGGAVVEKLQLYFASDISEEFTPPDELIENMIVMGSLAVVYGDSNSGKTFLALAMAASVASGETFFDRQVDPGLVIYLASEAPASIRSRIQAIKKHYDYDLSSLAVIPVPLDFYANDGDAIDVVETIKTIEKQKEQKARLIICDTLARMSAGANENSGEDMGPVMARFDRVAQSTGAAMLIIHHNGKDQAKGARGWSGIRAHIDTEIEVVEKDGIRSATMTKQRELPGKGDAIYFKLHVVEMGISKFGGQATTCVIVKDEEAEEKKPHKKPSKIKIMQDIFEAAWWESGAEERNGQVYLSRSGLMSYMTENLKKAKRTAENHCTASHDGGTINTLILRGLIEDHEKGWIYKDRVAASTLLMRKEEEKNTIYVNF